MKTPCRECAASSVWIAVAKVTRERGVLVMSWRCTLCAHEWTVGTARTKSPRASLRSKRARRRAQRATTVSRPVSQNVGPPLDGLTAARAKVSLSSQ